MAGPGTLRISGNTQLVLQTDVDFANAQVLLEGTSTVAGDFTMANQPGGPIFVDHSLAIPGPVTIGGDFVVVGSDTTVTVTWTFTLLATGRLDLGEGQFRAVLPASGTSNGFLRVRDRS